MKVKLLNDGFFPGMDGIKFPAVVDAEVDMKNKVARVSILELVKAGAEIGDVGGIAGPLIFFIGTECEVIEE